MEDRLSSCILSTSYVDKGQCCLRERIPPDHANQMHAQTGRLLKASSSARSSRLSSEYTLARLPVNRAAARSDGCLTRALARTTGPRAPDVAPAVRTCRSNSSGMHDRSIPDGRLLPWSRGPTGVTPRASAKCPASIRRWPSTASVLLRTQTCLAAVARITGSANVPGPCCEGTDNRSAHPAAAFATIASVISDRTLHGVDRAQPAGELRCVVSRPALSNCTD